MMLQSLKYNPEAVNCPLACATCDRELGRCLTGH